MSKISMPRTHAVVRAGTFSYTTVSALRRVYGLRCSLVADWRLVVRTRLGDITCVNYSPYSSEIVVETGDLVTVARAAGLRPTRVLRAIAVLRLQGRAALLLESNREFKRRFPNGPTLLKAAPRARRFKLRSSSPADSSVALKRLQNLT